MSSRPDSIRAAWARLGASATTNRHDRGSTPRVVHRAWLERRRSPARKVSPDCADVTAGRDRHFEGGSMDEHGYLTEEQDEMLRSAFKKCSMTDDTKTWIPFDQTNPPPPGDYWCEVPALTLRDGGCLCRALYWTGERWEGPGGEYEVGRFVPEMLPQLHGRGVAREMADDGDDWRLASALARIGDLESERDAAIAGEQRASKLFDLVSAERNELVRRTNSLERMVTSNERPEEAAARIMELESERDSMAIRIDRLSAELAKPEDQRLREVTEAMSGRAVMFDDIAARVRHELRDLDRWIARAGNAEREINEARMLCSKERPR